MSKKVARQLYFQAKGRNTYVLSIKFDTHFNDRTFEEVVDDLNIYLYKAELSEYDPTTIVKKKILSETEIEVLKNIIDNPKISKTELASRFDWSPRMVEGLLYVLEVFGYIKKENPSTRKSPWIVIRNIDDIKTEYTVDGYSIKVIK